MAKLLLVGDMHHMENYGHADKFPDRRLDERKGIEDAIVKASEGCDGVVLMGDIFNSRNNTSVTIRHFTEFLERFACTVYLISGNHSSDAAGNTAIDYLLEIKGKNWVVFPTKVSTVEFEDGTKFTLVPYQRPSWHQGIENTEQLVEAVLSQIPEGNDFVAIHHCLQGTKTESGQSVDEFHEAIFPTDRLLAKSKRVFGSHIHLAQRKGDNVFVVGAVMNNDVGEDKDKRVIVYDTVADTVESITLPGRKLTKLVNPAEAEIDAVTEKYPDGYPGLIRIVSEKEMKVPEGLAEAVVFQHMPKDERRKSSEDVTDYSMESLLATYAKARSIDLDELMAGYKLISE